MKLYTNVLSLILAAIVMFGTGCSSNVVKNTAVENTDKKEDATKKEMTVDTVSNDDSSEVKSNVPNLKADPKLPKTEGLIVDSPNIQFEGALEIERNPQWIKLRRFTSSVLTKVQPLPNFSIANANTSSGIVMRFRTSSKKITAFFSALPLAFDKKYGVEFAVYQDNQLYKEYKFSNDAEVISLEIESKVDGPATYEITFPSWASVAFTGLKLDPGTSLEKMPEEKKLKYLAMGDSITHGVGQGSATNKTYPYILSRKFGWELYNVAVGGSRVAPDIGKMISAAKFDVITILIGYNDWNGKNNAPTYKSDLNTLLNNIRESQPESRIFLITPTASKNQMSGKKTYTLDDYRKTAREVVKDRNDKGDKYIFALNGDELTTTNDLNDLVHLNIDGAKNFADKLYNKMSQILNSLPK